MCASHNSRTTIDETATIITTVCWWMINMCNSRLGHTQRSSETDRNTDIPQVILRLQDLWRTRSVFCGNKTRNFVFTEIPTHPSLDGPRRPRRRTTADFDSMKKWVGRGALVGRVTKLLRCKVLTSLFLLCKILLVFHLCGFFGLLCNLLTSHCVIETKTCRFFALLDFVT